MKNTRRDESGKLSAIENKKTQNSIEFWVLLLICRFYISLCDFVVVRLS